MLKAVTFFIIFVLLQIINNLILYYITHINIHFGFNCFNLNANFLLSSASFFMYNNINNLPEPKKKNLMINFVVSFCSVLFFCVMHTALCACTFMFVWLDECSFCCCIFRLQKSFSLFLFPASWAVIGSPVHQI